MLLNPIKTFSSNTLKTNDQTHSTDFNQLFTRVPERGRAIYIYSGYLPCLKSAAQHILQCEHLKQLPNEKHPPYRAEADNTHQFWIWYKLKNNPEKLYLLLHEQFNLAISGKEPDWVAGEITDFLAHLLMNSHNPQSVLYHKGCDLFWSLAIDRKLKSLQAVVADKAALLH